MAKSLIPAVWELPTEIRNRLGERAGRQRCMEAEGHLLLVLHRPPQPNEDERAAALFWRRPNGEWASTEQGSGLASLQSHLNGYDEIVDELEASEVKANTAQEYFSVLERLVPIQRASRNMHVVMQEARKSISNDRDLINLRDRAYEIERRTEILYAGCQNGLEYAIARKAEEQAEASARMAKSAHRLNLLAAFFFPFATIAGVFGMNVKSGLEDSPAPQTFLLMLGIGLVAGIFLTTFITSRNGKS